MTPTFEKRLLQAAIIVGAGVSILFALSSIARGVAVLMPGGPGANINLDSHFRYLSGIFLGVLIAFYSCVPDVERKGPRLRLLGLFVVAGGLARLLGAVTVGMPGGGHIYGLGMELVVTPLLLLWQTRVARRHVSAA